VIRRSERFHIARGTIWASAAAGVLALGVGVACSKSDKVTGPAGQLHTIVVAPSSATMAEGTSKAFTATGQDASGHPVSGLTFFWSSSDTTVATVTQGGQVTAVDTGKVQIAASVGGVSGFASVTVSQKPVGSIVVAPTAATLRIATTLQLTDTVKDASGHVLQGQTVTWSSDTAAIVAVDANGLVIARAIGVAHITATSGGKSAQATITVSSVPVASIIITPPTPSVFVAQTTQLTAVTKDSAGNILPGRVVRWSASNTAIATVDSISGLVTGAGAGSTSIKARSEGVTDSVTVTVSNAPPSTVILSPSVSQVDVGQTVQLTAVVTNSSGNPISNPTVNFTSNKTNVASVTSQAGATAQILAGPNAGTATITGTSGAATGTATMIVSLTGVDSVHISAANDTLTPGQSETLTATAYDSSGNILSGRPVTWQSSNTAVATINGGGTVTAQSTPGVAVIFATISGVKGSLALVVNPVPVGSVTISPHADTIAIVGQLQLTSVVRDIHGTIINPSQTWYSANNSIAVVTSSGLVTGVSAGQTMIIDSVGGKADTNTTLVVTPVASVVVYPTPDTIFATAPGNTVQLADSTKDAGGHNLTGRPVAWSPTSGGAAKVNNTSNPGLVTATGASTSAGTTITATSSDGPSGTATIVVLGHSDSVAVNITAPDTLSPSATGFPTTTTATVTVLDNFGSPVEATRPVTWQSSDGSTVTINDGATLTTTAGATVTLKAVSTNSNPVTITVTAVDNASATNNAPVTVVP
jgi:trimeric autotransporter adhesin